MRINNTQSVNFQKKLIGLGAIRQEDISKTVKFFQLDDVSDMLDLKKARKTSNWFGNRPDYTAYLPYFLYATATQPMDDVLYVGHVTPQVS